VRVSRSEPLRGLRLEPLLERALNLPLEVRLALVALSQPVPRQQAQWPRAARELTLF
jgi:hypothetical protein